MKINNQVPLERLIGKIDNDFNISESDWIPRVAAWTIDALSQMKCLPMERKKRKLEVYDKIATFPCELNAKNIKVYDSNGCEVKPLNKESLCCSGLDNNYTNSEIAVYKHNPTSASDTVEVRKVIGGNNRNFVLQGNNIELNFEADEIIVETYEVATYHDDYYDCEVPYIYDNGDLLEALAWYVMFKYLSRGGKHQVYSLTSNNQILNPYIQWTAAKTKATVSVRNQISKDIDGWRNFFYNSTFDPRR